MCSNKFEAEIKYRCNIYFIIIIQKMLEKLIKMKCDKLTYICYKYYWTFTINMISYNLTFLITHTCKKYETSFLLSLLWNFWYIHMSVYFS